jgi:type I restriction enzyme M protein
MKIEARDMTEQQKRDALFNKLWQACEGFCGGIDATSCKDYILTLLFVKYLSDLHHCRRTALEIKYKGDPIRVERALGRERFVIPQIEIRDKNDTLEEVFPALYDSLYERRTRPDIGHLINIVLAHLEEANKSKLRNVFRDIDFNSQSRPGQARRRNKRLKHLLEALGELDAGSATARLMEVIGDIYERLIEKFAATAGKKAEEYHTPATVSETLARLVAPGPGDRICDPACGSGSLLVRAGIQVGSNDYALYGQEVNAGTWALCKMNMCLHGMDAARIEWGDTLRHPRLVDSSGALIKFDVVVADPPFSMDQWGQEVAANDPFGRFVRGIPPKSKGDWAFISHMLATAAEGSGRVGVVVAHGVLFRGGQEGRIREAVIRENRLDGVVGLPANLFFGTGIPAALMIFNKARPIGQPGDVLFIDASREFEQGTGRNRLRPQDIEKIVTVFKNRRTIDKYAYLASYKEIEENAFNLNIARYVDPFEPQPGVDIKAVQDEIATIERQLAQTRAKMQACLKVLGSIE